MNSKIGSVCLLIALLLLPAAAQAQAEAVPLPVYWQTLADLAAQLDELAGQTPAAQRTALTAAAAELNAIQAVTLPDGRRLSLDHGVLVTALRRDPPDIEQLQTLVAAWIEASESWPAAQFGPEAEAALAEILARAPYQYEEDDEAITLPDLGLPAGSGAGEDGAASEDGAADTPPPGAGEDEVEIEAAPSALERFWLSLADRLAQFLSWLFPDDLGFLGSLMRIAVVVATVVALAFVLTYIGRGLMKDMVMEARLRPEAVDAPLTAAAALEQAESRSNVGDYRDAVRYLYLSTLLILEEQGHLRYDRSRTNREYLRGVAGQPQLFNTLRDVVEVFDRVWYGFRPISDTDYRRYQAQVEALQKLRGV